MECMSRNPLTLSLGDHSLQSHALSVFFFMFFIQISLIRLVLLTFLKIHIRVQPILLCSQKAIFLCTQYINFIKVNES